MKILLAEMVNGAWHRVAVLSVGESGGGYNLPVRCQGQLSGAAARAAVNQFRAESAAAEVEITLSGHEFRATRF